MSKEESSNLRDQCNSCSSSEDDEGEECFVECDDYDPYHIPADLKLAELHAKSNSIGIKKHLHRENICKCCVQIKTEPFNLCRLKKNDAELAKFGLGYPLYMKMLKFTIAFTIFPLTVYAIIHMIINSQGNVCKSAKEINEEIGTSYKILKTWQPKPPSQNFTSWDSTFLNYNYHNQYLEKITDEITPIKTKYKETFDPDAELANTKKLPLLLFMKFYCWGRFLGNDKYCNRYYEEGCDLGFAFKKDGDKSCKKLAFFQSYMQKLRGECELVAFPFFSNLSIANRLYEQAHPQNEWVWILTNYFTMFFMWIMVQFWSIYFRHKRKYYNKKNHTAKDYTVVIRGLPRYIDCPDYNIEEAIRKRIQKENEIGDLKEKMVVDTVSCVYDCQEYKEMIIALREKKIKLAKKKYHRDHEIYTKPEEIEKNNQKLEVLQEEIFEDEIALNTLEEDFGGRLTEKFTGQAFVSFKFEYMRKVFYKKFKLKGLIYKYFNICPKRKAVFMLDDLDDIKHSGFCMQAPEPLNVLWENLPITGKNRRCMQIFSWIIGMLALVSFFFIILISCIISTQFNIEISKNSGSFVDYGSAAKAWWITHAPSIIIFILGYLTNKIVQKQANISYPKTNTWMLKNVVKLSYKIKVFNATMPPVIGTFGTMYYFNATGQVMSTTRFMILNILLSNSMLILDWRYFVKLSKQWLTKRKLQNENCHDKIITQKELNTLLEKNDFDMTGRITSFYTNLGYSMFFQSFIPYATLLSLVSIIVEFCVSWYILSRRSNSAKSYSFDIGKMFAKEYEFIMVIYAWGLVTSEVVFGYRDLEVFTPSFPSVAQLIIAIINYFFEKKWLKEKLFKFFQPRLVEYDRKVLGIKHKVFNINTESFPVVKRMVRDYASMNPVNMRFRNDKNMLKLKAIRKQQEEDQFKRQNTSDARNTLQSLQLL